MCFALESASISLAAVSIGAVVVVVGDGSAGCAAAVGATRSCSTDVIVLLSSAKIGGIGVLAPFDASESSDTGVAALLVPTNVPKVALNVVTNRRLRVSISSGLTALHAVSDNHTRSAAFSDASEFGNSIACTSALKSLGTVDVCTPPEFV